VLCSHSCKGKTVPRPGKTGLSAGAACRTANWSKVARKIQAHGRDWSLGRALLASYDLRLEPVSIGDSEQAAVTWAPGTGISLADRLCLALGAPHGRRSVGIRHQLGKQRGHPANPHDGPVSLPGSDPPSWHLMLRERPQYPVRGNS
jgi:hypothetical protein